MPLAISLKFIEIMACAKQQEIASGIDIYILKRPSDGDVSIGLLEFTVVDLVRRVESGIGEIASKEGKNVASGVEAVCAARIDSGGMRSEERFNQVPALGVNPAKIPKLGLLNREPVILADQENFR